MSHKLTYLMKIIMRNDVGSCIINDMDKKIILAHF